MYILVIFFSSLTLTHLSCIVLPSLLYYLTIRHHRKCPDFPETTNTAFCTLVIKGDFHEAGDNSNGETFIFDGVTATLCTIHIQLQGQREGIIVVA